MCGEILTSQYKSILIYWYCNTLFHIRPSEHCDCKVICRFVWFLGFNGYYPSIPASNVEDNMLSWSDTKVIIMWKVCSASIKSDNFWHLGWGHQFKISWRVYIIRRMSPKAQHHRYHPQKLYAIRYLKFGSVKENLQHFCGIYMYRYIYKAIPALSMVPRSIRA